ncbi:MAG TPA: YceH family protein [Phycisphaerae bacterium]|nr:YceH family protein [Phycisphaerae bacterium]
MEPRLSQTERRVLGVLLEKSLAQPTYYPMTVNALLAACNQKQNRDPVMNLDEDTVFNTVEHLRQRGLASKVLPGPGARTDRFKHEVAGHFGWEKREQAVMAELLLRGPQTVGELRTRCSRMVPFDNLEMVSAVLDDLAHKDPPLTAPLPREPGRSAIRHTHLLYPEDEQPASAAPAPASSAAGAPPAPAPSTSPSQVQALQSQIDAMQTELADLHETVTDLRVRLDAIEGQLL